MRKRAARSAYLSFSNFSQDHAEQVCNTELAAEGAWSPPYQRRARSNAFLV